MPDFRHTLRHPETSTGERWLGIVLVAVAHGAVLTAMLMWTPARELLSAAVPIMVEFITPPQPPVLREKPKPLPVVKPTPATPRPPEPAPVTTLPVIAVAEDISSPVAVAPSPPAPPNPPPVTPAPEAVPLPPPQVVPPRFDAAYLNNPPPTYPTLSRRMREQGRVILRVLVNAAGNAERVELRASSGSNRLDEAAQDTVRRWRFVPARRGSEAVAAWVLVPISFALEG